MRRLLIAVSATSVAAIVATLALTQTNAEQSSNDPMFTVASEIITRPQSGVMVLEDINGDGRLDLVVQHLLERRVALHLNLGEGRFQQPIIIEHELEPGTITLGHWNDDKLPDLAIASKNHDTGDEFVYVLLAQRDGRFLAPQSSRYRVGHSANGYKPFLKVADINGDGRDDIVTASARRDSIEILLGQGDGLFAPAAAVALYDAEYHTFDLADVNADGHLDLIIASQGNEGGKDGLAVHAGDGRGGFAPARPIDGDLLPAPRLLAASDVNHDSRPDIILGHVDTSRLSILLSQRDGSFVPAPGSPFAVAAQAFAVAVDDANGDGRADIFAATADSVSVLLSADNRLGPAAGSPFTVRPGAYNIVAGDLTGDGKTDILASSFDGESATMITGL